MLKLTVKSIWKGRVAIRDKYLSQAFKEGLQVKYEGSVMTLATKEVEGKIKGRSEKPVFDKFNNEYHHLIYFAWHPDDVNQEKLL